jgi:hypothetical protein
MYTDGSVRLMKFYYLAQQTIQYSIFYADYCPQKKINQGIFIFIHSDLTNLKRLADASLLKNTTKIPYFSQY